MINSNTCYFNIIRNTYFVLYIYICIFTVIYFLIMQVKKTFMEPNWWSHHDKWGNKRYSWLPTREEIPKNLGEIPTIAHLQDLDVSNLL